MDVAPGKLNLTYPLGNASSIFTFMVSPAKGHYDIASWNDVVGLAVNVTGNANMTYSVSFYGNYGGSGSPIK